MQNIIIKNKIRISRGKKYQKVIYSKKIIYQREIFLKRILNTRYQIKSANNLCNSCDFFKKNLNTRNSLIFYKKFNANLKLKEKYNLINFKKKTNKDACFYSYLLLSKFIIKNKKIENLHKLNFFLKVNDLLILLFKKKKHKKYLYDFIININFEKKLIRKFL